MHTILHPMGGYQVLTDFKKTVIITKTLIWIIKMYLNDTARSSAVSLFHNDLNKMSVTVPPKPKLQVLFVIFRIHIHYKICHVNPKEYNFHAHIIQS
jgi:hypothetical protein